MGRGTWKAHKRRQKKADRAYLAALLQHCGHNISQAARESGVNRTHLYRMLHEHGLDGNFRGYYAMKKVTLNTGERHASTNDTRQA